MSLVLSRSAARPAVLVLVVGFALGFVVAPSSPARAQGGAEAAVEGPDAEKEARRLFQNAELSFNVGKFTEALADYQAAYQAKPLPGFLFNIAQCYRNLGDYERARFFFRRYLTLEPRTPNRRRALGLIAEMSKKLDEKPPEAAAPGVAAAAEPKAAEAPPPVAAPPPAGLLPEVAPAPPTAPLLVTTTAPPPGPRPIWKRWWFWTGVGVVVAGGVVTAIVLSRPDTRAPGTLPPIDAR